MRQAMKFLFLVLLVPSMARAEQTNEFVNIIQNAGHHATVLDAARSLYPAVPGVAQIAAR